jgi:hypothetical protein
MIIDFKGLIEPAFEKTNTNDGIRTNAGFMTQQGHALQVHTEALL